MNDRNDHELRTPPFAASRTNRVSVGVPSDVGENEHTASTTLSYDVAPKREVAADG